MGGVSWINIIYLLGVLLLISPLIAFIFKAPNALRNATIWLAIIAALGWAYQLFGDKFAGNFINTPPQYSTSAAPKPEAEQVKLPEDEANAPYESAPFESAPYESAPTQSAPAEEDNPIRNP